MYTKMKRPAWYWPFFFRKIKKNASVVERGGSREEAGATCGTI